MALVTGASRGIGRAVALALAGRGATVMAAAREGHAQAVVDEIKARGGQAESVSIDVTGLHDIQFLEFLAQRLPHYAPVDC